MDARAGWTPHLCLPVHGVTIPGVLTAKGKGSGGAQHRWVGLRERLARGSEAARGPATLSREWLGARELPPISPAQSSWVKLPLQRAVPSQGEVLGQGYQAKRTARLGFAPPSPTPVTPTWPPCGSTCVHVSEAYV